jgi:aryl-alcohol dehydrogenase
MEVTAAVLREAGGTFGLEKVHLDAPRPGEVLVQINAVGICHTDLATRDGALPFPLPGVLGHEGAGVVVEVGEGVTKVAPGDPVGVTFASCGSCPACAVGAPAYCHRFMELNWAGVRSDGSSPISNAEGPVGSSFFGQSSFATHALAGERSVVKVGSDLPLHLAAPLGCGIQTGAGTIMRTFAAPAGSSVLISGAGSVGLSAVLGAVVQGCAHIIVVETVAARRELATRLGATHVIDPAAGAISEQVGGLLPEGVNFAVDTTGNVGVLVEALKCLGKQGTVGIVGVPSDLDAALPVPLIQSLALGLTVKGINEGDSDPDVFIPQLIELYQAGKFPFDELITTVPFSKINDGAALQDSGQAVKVVLVHDADQ